MAVLAILGLTAVVYWRVTGGDFVWDDIVCLSNQPWMLKDDAWRDFFAHDYCGIPNYFRPLASALFMLEMRVFDASPARMHLVSLALHLANCVLVWRLALAFRFAPHALGRPLSYVAMMLYALHPALIEPVAWISAQTELTVTLFVLMGLLANLSIDGMVLRAAIVSICFLLAACCKESAVAFPLAIVVCDWMRQNSSPDQGPLDRLRAVIQRQWVTYVGIVVAGLLYLSLRYAQLGYVLHTHDTNTLPLLAQLQVVCYLYCAYWRLIVWPMVGLGPVHLLDEASLASISPSSLLIDAAAIAIALVAGIAGWKRKAPGFLLAGTTVLLLPVLHVIPVAFDESIFHDRYLMTPLAFALAALPNTLGALLMGARMRTLAIGGALAVWIGFALANIHVTLPLWGDNTSLWRWALQREPDSISARENLFGSYVMHDDPRASSFARGLVDDPNLCSICLLNVAYFGLLKHDLDLTTGALARLEASGAPGFDARMLAAERVAVARLLEEQGELAKAEAVYRSAITSMPHDPELRMSLALLLTREGREVDARRTSNEALELMPAQDREQRRREFEQTTHGETERQP
jgi:hypothetical protein